MNETGKSDAVSCPSCRGRGWKIRRSRRAVVAGLIGEGGLTPRRQSCPDCCGSGKLVMQMYRIGGNLIGVDPNTDSAIAEIDRLATDFPAFRVWREIIGDRTRYIVRGRHLDVHPYAIVTADLAEIRIALAVHVTTAAGGRNGYASS